MKITVDALLKAPFLDKLKIIAGHEGLIREVSAISIMDAPDSYKWLRGNEIILTTGFIFGGDDWQVEHFVRNLIEAGCSAVGIKKGRFLSNISEIIIQIAQQNQFPIIEIPHSFGWSDIISCFYQLKFGFQDFSTQTESFVAFYEEQMSLHPDSEECLYRDFLHKLHCEQQVTSQDIIIFEKNFAFEKKSFYSVLLINGQGRDDVLRSIKNVICCSRFSNNCKAKTFFVDVEEEQEMIVLFEVNQIKNEAYEKWQYLIAEELECCTVEISTVNMSMGTAYLGISNITRSYTEAIKARNIGRVIMKNKRFYFYPLLSVYSIIQYANLSKDNLIYIKTLNQHQNNLAYDSISNLEIYIECGSFKKASDLLYVHENTLRHRIQIIADILHLDLKDNAVCNALLTQIKLWRLTENAGDGTK